MAPTLVSACCGIGSAARGFQDAGFHVKAGIDEDLTAIDGFKRNYPHAMSRTYAERVNKKLVQDLDVLLMTPREILTASTTSYSFYFYQLAERFRPKVAVLIVPTGPTRGTWVENYMQGMKRNCYHTVVANLNTCNFGCPIDMRKTVCISVESTILDGDPREVLADVIMNIANKRIYPRQTPRSILSDIPDDKDGIFLYPRNKKEAGVFSVDDMIPMLRTNCTCTPPEAYKKRSGDKGEVEKAIVPTLEQVRKLMCLPPSFVPTNTSRTMAAYHLTHSLPVPFVRCIAEAVFAIPVLEVPNVSRRVEGIAFPVSVSSVISKPVENVLFSRISGVDSVHRPSKSQPVHLSRLDKMLSCSFKIREDEYKGRRAVKYMIGGCKSTDSCVGSVIGITLPVDWSVEIRERDDMRHARDDLIITNPTGKKFYSIRKVRACLNNH